MRANSQDSADISTTLIRGLEVLQCFTDKDIALSNAEISRRLNINRPTISRLCKTLMHVGFLRRDGKGYFRLAPNLLSLAYPFLSTMPWRHNVPEMMSEVAQMTGGSMTLSVMSGDRFVQIKTAGQRDDYPHVPEIGLNGPLMHSATGRALLSLLDGQALSEKMDELLEGEPANNHTQALEKTHQLVEQCRTVGFCVSYGEWRSNIVAAATPLGTTDDGLLVALACGMPKYRVVTDQFESDIGPRFASVANALRGQGLFH